ncbi:MAG: hypothetical protein VST67_08980, partial [Nitrospirota bacterium]|nr:hypothetical protein [Nitrospirota bacterium]
AGRRAASAETPKIHSLAMAGDYNTDRLGLKAPYGASTWGPGSGPAPPPPPPPGFHLHGPVLTFIPHFPRSPDIQRVMIPIFI